MSNTTRLEKVLVVDSSNTMLRIISNTLNGLGFEDIDKANDGIEATKLFNSKYDIIITDWILPNKNGLELVKTIRKSNKDLPIIMITSEGGKNSVIKALKQV